MNGRSLFFKLDLEAFAALRSYRRAIGLDDSAPVQLLPNQVFQEMEHGLIRFAVLTFSSPPLSGPSHDAMRTRAALLSLRVLRLAKRL